MTGLVLMGWFLIFGGVFGMGCLFVRTWDDWKAGKFGGRHGRFYDIERKS